jgi:hypothetical protein
LPGAPEGVTRLATEQVFGDEGSIAFPEAHSAPG